jgi:hypothetical protein
MNPKRSPGSSAAFIRSAVPRRAIPVRSAARISRDDPALRLAPQRSISGSSRKSCAMSDRIRDHFAQGQAFGPGFDLKRGRGGIREIEFFAQVHQLIYGGRDPSLRVPATVDALAALAAAGRVEPEVVARLSDHYAVLRRIEHRLQMIEDQQTHSLPTHEAALDCVARLDGEADGAALLAALAPVVTGRRRLLRPARRRARGDDGLAARRGGGWRLN